jgi:Lysylphosphatidylglycerol synthase TM region
VARDGQKERTNVTGLDLGGLGRHRKLREFFSADRWHRRSRRSSQDQQPPPAKGAQLDTRVVGVALALATLVWTFRDSEPARVFTLLSRVGAAGSLVLLPQLASLFVESMGWAAGLSAMGRPLPLLGLFRTRLATEALAQTLPLGPLFCESMKPMLLAKSCGADLPTSLSGMALRKWLLISTQSLYVGVFALLAWPVLARISRPLLGVAGLPVLLAASASLLLLMSLAGHALLARGGLAAQVRRWLLHLPSAWLRARVAPVAARLPQADAHLRTFFRAGFRSPWPYLGFLCGWLFEAAETSLILYLLGVRLPWEVSGAVEVTTSLLRNVAVLVPAGLGVQDVSYLAFLRALHVPDALNVTAAFLLLKRGKECFWASCGYALLAFELRTARLPSRAEQTC